MVLVRSGRKRTMAIKMSGRGQKKGRIKSFPRSVERVCRVVVAVN